MGHGSLTGERGSGALVGSARRLRRIGVGTALLVALLVGCGFGGGEQAGTFDYSGSWRGTANDEVNGSGVVQTTLEQRGHAVAGTWHAVMGGDAARQDGGSWEGQLFFGDDRDILDVTLRSTVPGGCTYTLRLSRTQESLSGDYAPSGDGAGCAALVRGTIQLTKQN